MRTDPVRVLEEIKRLAVEQLGAVPAGLYAPIAEMLHESSMRSGLPGGRRLDEQALLLMRQHSATYTMRFRQLIAQGFDDFRALRIRHAGDLPLGLVAENQLQFHLAGQRLAEAIEQRYAKPLEQMTQSLELLSVALDVPQASNPIGANRLAAAFIETFRDVNMPDTLQPLVFRQYEQELARVLGDLYNRATALLASCGYGAAPTAPKKPLPPQPRFDAEVPRYDPSNELVPTIQRPPRTDPAAAAALQDLRRQLHAWRTSLAPGDGTPGPQQRLAPRREMRNDEVVTITSLLQPEPPDAYARALAGTGVLADAIRDHLVDGARRLGLNPDQTRLSTDQEDAIDLVALMFESLFKSYALLERARRLYARLVLPYVKAAMLDTSLFVQREHPARKLLDAITEACEGNAAATPQDRELLERAAAVSQRVVADFNQDLAVFTLAHAELEDLLAQQRKRVELQEARAAKATFGRERLGEARERADQVLEPLFEAPLAPEVGDFLAGSWRHHVVQTLLREGADAGRQADVVSLGAALAEADRISRSGRGAELADRLLALEPAITECLVSSGLDHNAAMQGFTTLVRALAFPDTPREVHPMPPAAASDAGPEDATLWLAGGTATIDHDPELAARMRRLLPGDWLRLMDPNGESLAAKVAWISPLTSRFLLVNRRGMRVLVASAEELAALAQAGRLVVGAESTPCDEAMRQVRNRLDRVAGQS